MTERTSIFRRRRVLILLGVNAAALLLLAAVFEIGLRIFAPDWLSATMDYQSEGGRADEVGTDRAWSVVREYGEFVKFVPHSDFDMVHAEFREKANIDEFGGRRLEATSSGDAIVPFVGDSFVFGIGVADGETFVDAMQEHFDERLLNLGVPGSSLPEQRFIVKRRHEELGRPALCFVVVFLGNDLTDMVNRYREAARRAATGAPRGQPAGMERTRPQRSLAWRMNAWLHESWIRRLYSVQYLKAKALAAMNRRGGRGNMDPVFRVMNPGNEELLAEVRDILAAELDEWETLRGELGTEFVFVLIPDRHQVVAEERDARAKYYHLDPALLDPGLPNRVLTDELLPRGFRAIDTTDAIRAAGDPARMYFRRDNHLTKEGHALVARTVLAELGNE